jgi:hypothetical protein
MTSNTTTNRGDLYASDGSTNATGCGVFYVSDAGTNATEGSIVLPPQSFRIHISAQSAPVLPRPSAPPGYRCRPDGMSYPVGRRGAR